ESDLHYSLLWKGARRYIAEESRLEGIAKASEVVEKGYRISLEYIGENTTSLEESQKAKEEFIMLIEEMGSQAINETVSLDLSHIGLSIEPKIAYHHLLKIAKKASLYGILIMISMEESSKTDAILNIYKQVSRKYENVGITIQAHLFRSTQDIKELMGYPGKIRVVKGAYKEPENLALPRSKQLNNRYIDIVEQLMEANHSVSIATYDIEILEELEKRNYFHLPNAEIEMLYGIQPQLLEKLKNKDYPCKIYLTYGKDWYLYVCHRIAEHQ